MKMGNNGRFYKIIKATALVIGLALVIVIPVVKWHMRQEAAKIIQEDQQKIFKDDELYFDFTDKSTNNQ